VTGRYTRGSALCRRKVVVMKLRAPLAFYPELGHSVAPTKYPRNSRKVSRITRDTAGQHQMSPVGLGIADNWVEFIRKIPLTDNDMLLN